jgi:hypothetical protein
MSKVCFVGMPMQTRARVEGAAKRKGIEVTSLLADVGSQGTLKLVPNPDHALYLLQAFTTAFDDLAEAEVVVLPYVHLPAPIADELDALEALGGKIVRPEPDGTTWPGKKTGKLDQAFLDHLFRGISTLLPQARSPSEHFKEIAERNNRFILTKGALDLCDEVAEHRLDFLLRVANAFELFLNEGSDGRIDAFFQKLGLDHAQTGGISATLEVQHEGKTIHRETTNIHLKQGDKTTAAAAVRVYYQRFSYNQQTYVAVLYAGPHPETDVSRLHELAKAE